MAQQEFMISLLPRDCDVAILAGGKATRLQPVVSDRPKFLAEIGGRPFAHYQLTELARAGFRRAVICTGHLAYMIEAALGPRWMEMDLIYSREEIVLDTGGAVRLALNHLTASHAIVLNGDTFVELDYAGLLSSVGNRGAIAALATIEVDEPQRYGAVDMSPDGLIQRLVEKGQVLSTGPAAINAGVYLLPRSLIESIPEGRKISLERDLLPHWIQQGIVGFPAGGPFIDIGTPASYTLAQSVLAKWAKLD